MTYYNLQYKSAGTNQEWWNWFPDDNVEDLTTMDLFMDDLKTEQECLQCELEDLPDTEFRVIEIERQEKPIHSLSLVNAQIVLGEEI